MGGFHSDSGMKRTVYKYWYAGACGGYEVKHNRRDGGLWEYGIERSER